MGKNRKDGKGKKSYKLKFLREQREWGHAYGAEDLYDPWAGYPADPRDLGDPFELAPGQVYPPPDPDLEQYRLMDPNALQRSQIAFDPELAQDLGDPFEGAEDPYRTERLPWSGGPTYDPAWDPSIVPLAREDYLQENKQQIVDKIVDILVEYLIDK